VYFTVPRTELIGEPDRYVKVGSTVALHCVVRGALEPPSYIIWYHDAHQLLSENQQKWKIKLDRGMPDSDGDIPNVVSKAFRLFDFFPPLTTYPLLSFQVCHLIN
jgi:hypothetical protein